MYNRGVACFSCHDVHGTSNEAQLRVPPREMCFACHGTNTQNGPHTASIEEHTHHKPGSSGSQCIACHMGYSRRFATMDAKDFGKWTTYGGGGYGFNPGPGNRDYWLVGWQLQRQITNKLTLGAELFHQTAFTTGSLAAPVFPSAVRPQPTSTSAASMISRRIYTSCFRPGVGSRTQGQAINSLVTWDFSGHFERIQAAARLSQFHPPHKIRPLQVAAAAQRPQLTRKGMSLISPARSGLVCQRLKWPVPRSHGIKPAACASLSSDNRTELHT
jgi:predicted CXXCH cytochrome family protein